MKLGWVVTCTTHCPGQFFLLLSKFLVWPFSQFGPWYMLMPQVHEARRVQPHFHKAGLNWSKSGSNHLLFIQNQVSHTAHTVHTIYLQILFSSIYYTLTLFFLLSFSLSFFFFPSIFSLSQLTSKNLGYSMVVIQLGPWGAEMYLSANKFRYINLSFCPGHYFLFQHNTIQGQFFASNI